MATDPNNEGLIKCLEAFAKAAAECEGQGIDELAIQSALAHTLRCRVHERLPLGKQERMAQFFGQQISTPFSEPVQH